MSRPLGTPEELERRRRRAVELLSQGESAARIARFLGVDRSSIYRWRQAASNGPQALEARPHPHRPPRLSDARLQELDALLQHGAQAHGWPNALGTTARVAELIRRTFGVGYHPDPVGRFLRQRLGWTPQKPERRARERDEEAILDWQSHPFPRIAREAQERNAHRVFLDESGVMLTPTVRRTGAPKGQTPILKSWDRRDRISAISSITVSPVNRTRNLYFDLLPDNTTVQAVDIVAYLRRRRAHLGGPMTVIWDGSQIHDRSRVVRAFRAKHPEIRTERLPAYAPERNPDELVGAWTTFGRRPNLAATNTDWLRDYLWTEMEYVRKHPDLLASFINATQLPIDL